MLGVLQKPFATLGPVVEIDANFKAPALWGGYNSLRRRRRHTFGKRCSEPGSGTELNHRFDQGGYRIECSKHCFQLECCPSIVDGDRSREQGRVGAGITEGAVEASRGHRPFL